MENNKKTVSFPLIVSVSVFLHVMFFMMFLLYLTNSGNVKYLLLTGKDASQQGMPDNDIVVNVNQNDIKDYNEKTFISDRDSEGTGKITEKKGRNWLNNSTEFLIKKLKLNKNPESNRNLITAVKDVIYKISFLNYVSDTVNNKNGKNKDSDAAKNGNSEWNRIPDVNDFKRENALYYSNHGYFSINTRKFKNFKYFNDMKNKIVSNWYPPVLSNSVLPRAVTSLGAGYTPGRTKFNLIPTQYVKLYFVMDRGGNVKSVHIFESKGYKPLDDSCIESITKSCTFGPVPDEIPGDEIYIQFWYGYIVD
ncbi:MAG: hypothetical protein JW982_05345 [Spirochaetes bacterium]|nr:hypothetical protein [Spirochaetota bacterium]